MKNKTLILDHKQVERRIERMAWQVLEMADGRDEIVLAGIARKGYVLAGLLKDVIERVADSTCLLVEVTIDKRDAINSPVEISVDEKQFIDRYVVLVDDVLNTGGTLAYCLIPFLKVSTAGLSIAVLVDRDHTRFPIRADIEGLSLSTTLKEHIEVTLDKGAYSVHLY